MPVFVSQKIPNKADTSKHSSQSKISDERSIKKNSEPSRPKSTAVSRIPRKSATARRNTSNAKLPSRAVSKAKDPMEIIRQAESLVARVRAFDSMPPNPTPPGDSSFDQENLDSVFFQTFNVNNLVSDIQPSRVSDVKEEFDETQLLHKRINVIKNNAEKLGEEVMASGPFGLPTAEAFAEAMQNSAPEMRGSGDEAPTKDTSVSHERKERE